MPYTPLQAGRDYVVSWRIYAPGAAEGELLSAAIRGTKALGLEPFDFRQERDGVRIEAHAFRERPVWLPVASGHLEAVAVEPIARLSGATTGAAAAAQPNAANVRRGDAYVFTFEPVTSYAWKPGEWRDLANEAIALFGFQVLEDASVDPRWVLAVAQADDSLSLPLEVARVSDWGLSGGPHGSPGFAAVQAFPARLRVTHIRLQEEAASSRGEDGAKVDERTRVRTGAAMPAPLVCRKLEPRGGAYAIAPGVRYRALVSVSSHFTTEAVRKYLAEHGWSDVVLVDEGAALPPGWPTDEDLVGLEAGHRWVRGEAVRSGEATTVDVVSTLHKLITVRLSIYRIADLWACEGAPASGPRAPAAPPPAAAPGPPALPRIGTGPGPGGLDERMPAEIAPSVVHAWQTEPDPGKLRALAATMRMGGYPIASQLLDQQALYAEADERAAERPAKEEKRGRGKALAIGLAAVGTLAALVKR